MSLRNVTSSDSPTLAFEPTADPVPADERTRRLTDPGFGRVFTDHMALIEYDEERGLEQRPHNGAQAIRAGSGIAGPSLRTRDFRGHEGYRRPNGKAALFRRTPTRGASPIRLGAWPCPVAGRHVP